MTADFGRIETCACCGRDVKKPVYSKRRNAYFGKACLEQICSTALSYQLGGLMSATRDAMTYKPRTWQRHLELALS